MFVNDVKVMNCSQHQVPAAIWLQGFNQANDLGPRLMQISSPNHFCQIRLSVTEREKNVFCASPI